MKNKLLGISLLVSLVVLSGLGMKCATVAPGNDPFVVRVEQTQTAASGAFDLVLGVDQVDRGFWKTNAPAFHDFCSWLRSPAVYRGTNAPKIVVIQLNVEDLKLSYKNNRGPGTSNALWTAWSVLDTAFQQASSWTTIVNGTPHP